VGKNLAWLVGILVVIAVGMAIRPQPSAPRRVSNDSYAVDKLPKPPAAHNVWGLDANGYRLLLELSGDGSTARLQNENGGWGPVQVLTYRRAENPQEFVLDFYRPGPKQWFRCRTYAGKLSGHFSHQVDKPAPKDFRYTVRGWSPPPPGWKVGH